jgi:hypothetical protein
MRVGASTPNAKTVPEAIRGVLEAVSPNVLREIVIAITMGKLDFGPWEQVFYREFGGPRPTRVLLKVLGE